jgi:hypothetical protein
VSLLFFFGGHLLFLVQVVDNKKFSQNTLEHEIYVRFVGQVMLQINNENNLPIEK